MQQSRQREKASSGRWGARLARLALGWGLLGMATALAQGAIPNATCLACHGQAGFATRLGDGSSLSLYVDARQFAHSVHGGKLACVDCHTDITTAPHPPRPFPNRRAVSLTYYQVCRNCHFEQYTRLLDSIHFTTLSKGNRNAPVCVDCHGAHDIQPPNQPRSLISRTCGKCHGQIEQVYLRSVHGRALVDGNPDVPVCTDCHQAHAIANPLARSWHLNIPQLCARCHANPALMAKYKISTQVLTTYLADFHGMTASLYRKENITPAEFTATCTDCHGVHDITPVTGAGSKVIKANLLKTCQRCHPGATANFPAAWLGHYAPSLRHAPLVYGVKMFYGIFIPFIIGGLILQILLHLWRVVVNR